MNTASRMLVTKQDNTSGGRGLAELFSSCPVRKRRRRSGSNLATPRLPRGDFYGYRLFRRYSPIGRASARPMHGTFRNYASYGFLMSLWLSFSPDRYRETGRKIAAPWGPMWLIYERRREYWGLGRFRMKRPFCGFQVCSLCSRETSRCFFLASFVYPFREYNRLVESNRLHLLLLYRIILYKNDFMKSAMLYILIKEFKKNFVTGI